MQRKNSEMNLTNNTRYARSSYAPERLTLRGGRGRVDEAEVCEFELVPDEGPQVVLDVVLGPRRRVQRVVLGLANFKFCPLRPSLNGGFLSLHC